MASVLKSRDVLVICCDSLPVAPLNGHNKKTHDVIRGLRPFFDIKCIVYPNSGEDWKRCLDLGHSIGVEFICLEPRRLGKLHGLYSAIAGVSLRALRRDFQREATVIRNIAVANGRTKVFVDFISGAPVLDFLGSGSGVMISGHDCMSYLFSESARWASNFKRRAHNVLRSRAARKLEAKYYHRASLIHVVSDKDKEEILKINPRANCVVIPISSSKPAEEKMAEFQRRERNIIWGYLGSDLIVNGLRRLYEAAAQWTRRPWESWTLLGGLNEDVAMQKFPFLAESGVSYLERVDDLDAFLGSTKTVVLPDISGTGQKNRTLAAMACGCCVMGLSEVFRGIDREEDQDEPYIVAKDYDELATKMSDVRRLAVPDIGRAARLLFETRFNLDRVKEQWVSSISKLPYIDLR